MHRYYVVQFINSEDGKCYFDVIPKNWRINKRTCYWPKNWPTRKIRQAVKNRSEVEDDWMVSQYVKIRQTYTFEEADYLAGRELIRYNKKVERLEKQRIKKEAIVDEEAVNTEQQLDVNQDDVVIEDVIGMPSEQLESQPITKQAIVDDSEEEAVQAEQLDDKNDDVVSEKVIGMPSEQLESQQPDSVIDYPQLSIPDAALPEIDNTDIISLLNEQNPELSFDQVPQFSFDQFPVTANNVQCYQLPQSQWQPQHQISQHVPEPVCYQNSRLSNRAFTDLVITDHNLNMLNAAESPHNGCFNLRTNQGTVRGCCEPNQHDSKRRRHHESYLGSNVAAQQPIVNAPVLSLVYNRHGELINETNQNCVFKDKNVECITLD